MLLPPGLAEPIREPVAPPPLSLTEVSATESEERPTENISAQEVPAIDEPTPIVSPVAETTLSEPSEAELALSESDFDSVTESEKEGPASWSVPGLPDVAALPEMTYDSDSNTGTDPGQSEVEGSDTEGSDEMASHLDVPPLNLAVPASPDPHGTAEMSEVDEQEIENMLATMMTPVTAAAGS